VLRSTPAAIKYRILCIQVWASSSASASAYSATNYGYSSHTRSPRAHHQTNPQSHLHPSTPSNTGATAAAPAGSSSSGTVRSQQHTGSGNSSGGTAALSVAVVQIGSSSSRSTAAVRERLFEPLDAAAGRDYRDQAATTAGQPVSKPHLMLRLSKV
jgi:hypothetical protein